MQWRAPMSAHSASDRHKEHRNYQRNHNVTEGEKKPE